MGALPANTRVALWAWRCAAVAAIAAQGSFAIAHEDLHEQIETASEQIANDPANTALLMRRSDLYRQHEDWDAALADIERVRRLDPQYATLDLALGRTLTDAGLCNAALVVLDRFLATNADHGPAWLTRARALIKLDRRLEAVASYDRVIAVLPDPKPDYFVERAQALATAGDEHLAAALKGLDEGIQRHGPLVALQSCALDLEVRGGEFDAALERLDSIVAQFQRKERWLARRGDILVLAGRSGAARQAYQAALEAIAALPPRHRGVDAVRELRARVRASLERITADQAESLVDQGANKEHD